MKLVNGLMAFKTAKFNYFTAIQLLDYYYKVMVKIIKMVMAKLTEVADAKIMVGQIIDLKSIIKF